MKITSMALALVVAAGCSDRTAVTAPDRVTIRVAPLDLPGITNARYTLTVTAGGQTVWQRAIDADGYGDGQGGVAYVGPCDASPAAQPNRVTLVLDALEADGADVPTATWQNPTPVAIDVICRENADTAVPFDLVIMRDASQGFFDVAVTFSDIFCSAKFDCADGLLHDGDARARTGVMGFACASGQGEQTTLYLSDVTVRCDGVPPVVLNPALGAGQHPVASPIVFAAGTYFGQEQLEGLDKCYWNTAIGLSLAASGELGANPANCRVTARGTASPTPLVGGRTPAGTRWPVIAWDVPITDAGGALLCGAHALNGADGAVATRYSDIAGEDFRWPYACGERPKLTCAGATPTVAGASILVDDLGQGDVRVDVGQAHTTLRLPAGVELAKDVGCCIAPCCDVSGAAP